MKKKSQVMLFKPPKLKVKAKAKAKKKPPTKKKVKPKANPTDAMMDKAMEIRERFSGEEIGDIRPRKISLPGEGEPLIVLAELQGVIYLSNKEEMGDDQGYEHQFEPDSRGKYPLLCCTVDRRTLIIIGGKFKVKSYQGSELFWLVD